MFFINFLPCLASSVPKLTELDFILSCKVEKANSQVSPNNTPSNAPGVKSIFVGAIRFYQIFISSQDSSVCNFIPSCSQFGIESIKQFGIIKGIFLTSDRLQRCNSISTSRYQMDYIAGKLIDPVKIYDEITK